MKSGKLELFFRRSRREHRLHLTSIDPARHSPDRLGELVAVARAAGTDGFLLGGSTNVNGPMVEEHCGAVRKALAADTAGNQPPLILFPSSAATSMASTADGVLFLSLLNSMEVRYLIREQAQAAPYLPALGLEPIGCGMIIVEPGGTAGRVGRAELLAPGDWPAAVGYAAAAQAFGFPLIYLNAGSGSPRPVPPEMIQPVAEILRVPLLVGGGLTDAAKVAAAVAAGADVVITGSVVEDNPNVFGTLREIAAVVHAAPARLLPQGDRER